MFLAYQWVIPCKSCSYVWKSSSIRYATFTIVGACLTMYVEVLFSFWQFWIYWWELECLQLTWVFFQIIIFNLTAWSCRLTIDLWFIVHGIVRFIVYSLFSISRHDLAAGISQLVGFRGAWDLQAMRHPAVYNGCIR